MGFKLMTNFNKPYHSRSISEFWKRWHISLSTWFKDYLYISLGGNRVSVPRMYFNLFFVFMVSGFWHGANWTFIAWGALHGFYLVFALFTKGVREKVANTLGITKFPTVNNTLNIITTFVLVNIAWVFFRAVNIHDALYIVRKFTSVPGEMLQVVASHHIAFLNLPGIYNAILPGFGLIAFLEIAHIIQHKYDLEHTFSARPTFVRWSLYFGGQAALFFLGVYQDQQFIYFQF
jgi:alginate O-acetyltransferase complex protein AlgI